jgi:ribonuclease Z
MFELTFLGTAASTPSAERGLAALLVGCGGERVLVDCGEGTQRQILKSGLGFRRLDRVLLTHAHLDHVLGLPGLVSTLGLLRAGDALSIGGSGRTLRFVAGLLAAVWPNGRAPVALELAPLEPGAVIEAAGFRIRCFAVRHRDTDSLGFRFETPPRRHLNADRLAALGVPDGPVRGLLARGETVVLPDGRRIAGEDVLGPPEAGASLAVVGDAEEVESLVDPVRGADALVIEATFLDADAALARARNHLTAGDAGRLAAAAGVGMLYLTLLSGRYDGAAVLAEARQHFPSVRTVADFETARVPPAQPRPPSG